MTIASTVDRVVYPGTGSTGPYTVPFRIFAAADVEVIRRSAENDETLLVLTTDYSVSGVGNAASTLTLVSALASGETLSIRRAPSLVQPTSIQDAGAYFAKTHEDEFDRLLMQVQSVSDIARRSARVQASRDPDLLDLELIPETGKVLAWDSATKLTNVTLDSSAVALPGNGRTVATLSAYLANNAIINVKDYGAVGDGSTNDRAAILAAIAAVPATGGAVYFPHSIAAYMVLTSMTVPSNVTFWFERGAKIDIAANQTITINSTIIAGRHQVFAFHAYTFSTIDVSSGTHTFNIPVSFARGMLVYPEWFGASGNDATHDDRPGIQAAHDAIWQGGTLDFGGKTYYVLSAGRTDQFGDVCGIWATNDYSINGHTAGLTDRPNAVWVGRGYYSTVIHVANSLGIDTLVCLYYNGQGLRVVDMQFNVDVDTGPGTSSTTCLKLAGNGVTYDRLGTGGGDIGIHLYSITGVSFGNDSWDEFSKIGLLLEECSSLAIHMPATYQGETAGIKVKNTAAGGGYAANQTPGPIILIAPLGTSTPNESFAVSIDVEDASRVAVSLIGASFGTNNLALGFAGGYALNVTQCYMLSVVGGAIWRSKYGVALGGGRYQFIGVNFYDTGVIDQTAPVASFALNIDSIGAYVDIIGCNFNNIAGTAIRSKGAVTRIRSCNFLDCANGGLAGSLARAGATNAAVGDKVLKFVPGTVDTVIEVSGCHFYGPQAENAGKYGIYIDGSTAVPAAGKVTIVGCTMDPNSFANPFTLLNVTTKQKNAWNIHHNQATLIADAPLGMPSYVDADAPNSTIYYSTTASKLVWKDAAGVVQNLY